jgi:hypothetical protein
MSFVRGEEKASAHETFSLPALSHSVGMLMKVSLNFG